MTEYRHVVGYALALIGAAAVIGETLISDAAVPLLSVVIPTTTPARILVMAALFALVESFVVHLQFHRQTQSFSLSEIPLVVGLFFLAPAPLLVARLLGSTAALVFVRRQPFIKIVFNVAYFTFDTMLMVAIFRTVLGDGEILGPRAWAGAHLAGVVGIVTGTTAVALAIWLTEKTVPTGLGQGILSLGLPTVFININFGLMTVMIVDLDARAGALLGFTVVALFVFYRSHTQLRSNHETLGELYAVTKTVDDALERGGAVQMLLQRTAEVMKAEHAELVVSDPSGSSVRSIWSTATGEFRTEPVDDIDRVHSAILRDRTSVILHSKRDADELQAIGDYHDAVLLRLHGDGHLTGTLVVGDRLGNVATFTPDDQRIFEMLGNHASIAMRNSSLLHRLRIENIEREYEALHDPLTGLPNRTNFDRSVTAALEASTGGEDVHVLLIDLDRFKEVNDTLGHQHGDRLLTHVSAAIDAAVGDDGFVARFGGDEFAVLIAGRDDEAAFAIAQRIRTRVATPFRMGDLPMVVNASIGIAAAPVDADDPETLLQRADVAMYSAKRRVGIARYHHADNHYSPERLAMVAELRAAIERNELLVEYQPCIDVRTGDVVSAEALARWHHPERGFIPPDEFIGIAERSGLIHSLTTLVLSTAMRQCAMWRRDGLMIGVAVNISARSLLDPAFADEVEHHLLMADLPPSSLTLEITESTIMDDPERTISMLNRMSSMGITLSVDDYGTGYSSLAYLKNLPVDELKLDRSFVTNMDEDHSDAVIVRNSIDLAHELGLRVVAEGVEDGETLDSLRALGCDLAQGYHIARPRTSSRLVSFATGHTHDAVNPPVQLAQRRRRTGA